MLAFMKGGASTPGDSSIPSLDVAGQNPDAASSANWGDRLSNTIEKMVQLLNAQNLQKTGENIDADTLKKQAEAEVQKAMVPATYSEVGRNTASAGALTDQMDATRAGINKIAAEVENINASTALTKQQKNLVVENITNAIHQTGVIDAEVAKLLTEAQRNKIEAGLAQLRMPQAQAEAGMWSGPAGKLIPYIPPSTQVLNSAAVVGGSLFGIPKLIESLRSGKLPTNVGGLLK